MLDNENFAQKHRKAHPDEKGTERIPYLAANIAADVYRKAHPDEKGTESRPENA